MTMGTAFGTYIRKRRQEKNLGLREAAGKLEITASYLSRLESGDEPNPPSAQVIERIAKLLDDDMKHLMMLAGRIEKELSQYVASTPNVADFLRSAREKGFGPTEFAKLKKQIEKKGSGEDE